MRTKEKVRDSPERHTPKKSGKNDAPESVNMAVPAACLHLPRL